MHVLLTILNSNPHPGRAPDAYILRVLELQAFLLSHHPPLRGAHQMRGALRPAEQLQQREAHGVAVCPLAAAPLRLALQARVGTVAIFYL